MKPSIRYKDGYKYQLYEAYQVMTGITGYLISDRYFALDLDGLLTIHDGYAWDGPSGPTIDTPNFMRGSLVHDALYQMIGAGMIGLNQRKAADQLLRDICREDGMSAIRAWWVYSAVRIAGARAAETARQKIRDDYATIQANIDASPNVNALRSIVLALQAR